MKRKNMSFASVAKLIGTSRAAARRLLLEDRISSYRHKQLEQAGISPSLLPLAQDIAPGPKPKVEIEPEPMEHAA
ncbi:MAG: hypothetical protein MI749_02885 [Desulfovibrionales bacterium]|nr:hypothetical protein [Desulfovibrionales bacterium]